MQQTLLLLCLLPYTLLYASTSQDQYTKLELYEEYLRKQPGIHTERQWILETTRKEQEIFTSKHDETRTHPTVWQILYSAIRRWIPLVDIIHILVESHGAQAGTYKPWRSKKQELELWPHHKRQERPVIDQDEVAMFKTYGWLSAAAYCKKQNIMKWNCGKRCIQGLQPVQYINTKRTGTVGFVARSNDTLYIVFRGTISPRNIITDISFRSKGGYHAGFLAAWKDAHEYLKPILREYAHLDLVMTGHSLGAAIAMVGGLLIHKDYGPFPPLVHPIHLNTLNPQSRLRIVTFGQPRAITGDLAEALVHANVPTFTVTAYNDPVPHLPPRFPRRLFNFSRTPAEYWIKSDQKTTVRCDDRYAGEDPHCANSQFLFGMTQHLRYWDISFAPAC